MYDVALVDGNNLFYKNFAVHKDFSVFTGGREVFTGGTWGLIHSLITLKKEYNPSEIVVCWDKGHVRRSLLYPEYKANRDKSDVEFYENFYTQMSMAKDVLMYLGVKQAFKEGEEADDIVGTLSLTYSNEGKKVLIMSADKDFQQLITENVDLLAHKGKDNIKLWNEVSWEEMNGFHPKHYSLVLGLMGDTGDNIPGVTGIGEKGAYKLIINNMEMLQSILITGLIEAPKKQTAAIKKLLVGENQELFRLSFLLALIDRYVENITISHFEKDLSTVEDLFEMYQFHNLLKKSNWEILEAL